MTRNHRYGRLERRDGRNPYVDAMVVTTLTQVAKASGKKGRSSRWYA